MPQPVTQTATAPGGGRKAKLEATIQEANKLITEEASLLFALKELREKRTQVSTEIRDMAGPEVKRLETELKDIDEAYKTKRDEKIRFLSIADKEIASLLTRRKEVAGRLHTFGVISTGVPAHTGTGKKREGPTKSSQAINMKKENPELSASEIAKRIGMNPGAAARALKNAGLNGTDGGSE